MRYSKLQHSFYPENVKYRSLPDDIVFVSDEEFRTAMDRKSGEDYDLIDGHIVIIPPRERTNKQIKDDIKVDIIKERERRKIGGFKVNIDNHDFWFPNDVASRIQQVTQSILFTQENDEAIDEDVFQFETLDGTYIKITKKIIFDVNYAFIRQYINIYKAEKNHLEALEKSEDPSKYNFLIGWPDIYDPKK